jgi:hypothetical protein
LKRRKNNHARRDGDDLFAPLSARKGNQL